MLFRSNGEVPVLGFVDTGSDPIEFLKSLCWVAREVYGENNPRWLLFRHWLTTRAPKWFFNLYAKHGVAAAAWLKRHPMFKPVVRRFMDSRIDNMLANVSPSEAGAISTYTSI